MNEFPGSPVVIVRWPTEADELERLRMLGVPRLLLLGADTSAPVDEDPRQDWIRMPAADADFWARVRALELRSGSQGAVPELEGDGRLQFRGRWVRLSPIAERLVGALVANFGKVVSAAELQRAGWPDGTGSPGALRIHVTKLRRTIDQVGLELALVPKRGYVLQGLVAAVQG